MKSGILIGGGPWGKVNTKFSSEMQAELTRYDITYKSNMMLGYRFRIPLYDIPAFMDIDAMIGLNNWNSEYKEKSKTPEQEILLNMIYLTITVLKTITSMVQLL